MPDLYRRRSRRRYRFTAAATIRAVAGLLLLACVTNSHAVQWVDNSISYTYGREFTEPGVARDVSRHIVEFVHANGYSLGNNLFKAKILQSSDDDPAESSGDGAREVYVLYRHLLSLGAVTGKSFSVGPVKDLGLTAGFDLNTKDNAFGTSKRLLVIGPTLKFDVPPRSVLNLSLLLANESNECNLPPCKAVGADRGQTFDNYPIVHVAWRFPIKAGSWNTRFEGFALKGFRRGDDYLGNPWADETLMRAAWLVDVGSSLIDEPDTLFVGIGYELWRNKFGSSGLPGVDTDAPTVQLKWHF